MDITTSILVIGNLNGSSSRIISPCLVMMIWWVNSCMAGTLTQLELCLDMHAPAGTMPWESMPWLEGVVTFPQLELCPGQSSSWVKVPAGQSSNRGRVPARACMPGQSSSRGNLSWWKLGLEHYSTLTSYFHSLCGWKRSTPAIYF